MPEGIAPLLIRRLVNREGFSHPYSIPSDGAQVHPGRGIRHGHRLLLAPDGPKWDGVASRERLLRLAKRPAHRFYAQDKASVINLFRRVGLSIRV